MEYMIALAGDSEMLKSSTQLAMRAYISTCFVVHGARTHLDYVLNACYRADLGAQSQRCTLITTLVKGTITQAWESRHRRMIT